MISDFRTDLLGGKNQALRMPVLGNIRAGIKRLVRPREGATDAQLREYSKDCEVYDKMVLEGKSWDEIEKFIGKAKGEGGREKSKLTPQNTDYFTVRKCDCRTNEENAEILHNLYADEDGKLRRFPVILLFNTWFENIPHELVCYSQNRWQYRSKYEPAVDQENGETGWRRICVMPAPYARKEGSQEYRRLFGGQDVKERGPCDPDVCPEYQKNQCTLSGYVQCIIPGTRGAGLWNIHSRSIYSFRQMMSQMALIEKTTGRLAGLIDPQTKRPLLWITKAADQEVSRFDQKKGESTRVEQDLIFLEADIDMYELLVAYQPQQVLARGEQARALLSGTNHAEAPARATYTVRPEERRPAPEPEKKGFAPDPISTGSATGAGGNGNGGATREAPAADDFVPEIEYTGMSEEEEKGLLMKAILEGLNCKDIELGKRQAIKKRYPDFSAMSIEQFRTMATEFRQLTANAAAL